MAAAAAATPSGHRWAVTAGAAALAFAVGVAGTALFRSEVAPETFRHRVALGGALPGFQGAWLRVGSALEPNGRGIVFADSAGAAQGAWNLWWKPAGEPDAVLLPSTERAVSPTFSPDGEWLAYRVGTELRKRPLLGGTSVLLTDSAGGGNVPAVAWLEDGTIVYEDADFALRRIPEGGGASTVLTTRDDFGSVLQVSGLLGGGGVLMVGCDGPTCPPGTAQLFLLDFARDTAAHLAAEVVVAWHVEEERVVYVDARGAVFSAPLDRDEMTLGTPTPLFDGVFGTAGGREMLMARDGTVLYRRGVSVAPLVEGEAPPNTELVWVTRSGEVTPVDPGWQFHNGAGNYGWDLSPDGTRVAYRRLAGGNLDIWVKDLPDGPERRLTFEENQQRVPFWTPDGRQVTYFSGEAGPVHVWASNADFTGTPRPLLEVGSYSQGLWSPDGTWLVLRAAGQTGTAEGARDIVGFRPGTDTVPVPLIATPYADEAPALSPDGRWLAYVSDETGRPEVFVVPFPDVGASKVQVSRDGGITPRWAHGGRELFFVGPAGMMAASVETNPAFRVLAFDTLFALPEGIYAARVTDFYDVAPDDQRFLMGRQLDVPDPAGQSPDAPAPTLILIQNFFTEMRERIGG